MREKRHEPERNRRCPANATLPRALHRTPRATRAPRPATIRPMPKRVDIRPLIGVQPRRASGSRGKWHPDSVIAELAARQHGIVARWQLLAGGITRHAIQKRLESGHLHLIHRGVYAVGHRTASQLGLWLGAVLAVRDGALSHRSAAALWRLTQVPHGPIEVLAAKNGRPGPTGVIVHRATCLTPADLAVREGIPVTSIARTLVDLATRVSRRDVREAFYRAESLRKLDRPALARCLEDAGTRRGSGVLRDLLDQKPLPLAETRSALERRFARFCRARDLQIPAFNVPIGDYEVDCLWREQRLVVELDSWEFHRDRDSFEADRRRDATLQSLGYRVVRVTHRRITQAGDELERELRTLLGPARRP